MDGLSQIGSQLSRFLNIEYDKLILILSSGSLHRAIIDFLKSPSTSVLFLSITEEPSITPVFTSQDTPTPQIAHLTLPYTINPITDRLITTRNVFCFIKTNSIHFYPLPASITSLHSLFSELLLQLSLSLPLSSPQESVNLFKSLFVFLSRLSTPIQGSGFPLPSVETSSITSSVANLHDITTVLDSTENAIKEWIIIINDLIKSDGNSLVKSVLEREPGPLGEVQYWKRRSIIAQTLCDQLREREVKSLLAILNTHKSKILKEWKLAESTLQDFLTESKEVCRIMTLLEKNLNLYYSLDPSKISSISDSFSSLFSCLRSLALQTSSYSNSDSLTEFCHRIVHQVIQWCKNLVFHIQIDENFNLLTSNSMTSVHYFLYSNPPTTIFGRLLSIQSDHVIQSFNVINQTFQDFKNSFEHFKNKESTAKSLISISDSILIPFESFNDRCGQIANFINIMSQLLTFVGENSELSSLCQSFFDWVKINMISRDYDPFFEPVQFDLDYSCFLGEVESLSEVVADFISNKFFKSPVFSQKVEFLLSLEPFLNGNFCKDIIDTCKQVISELFLSSISIVEEEFENFKSSPPPCRDVSPLTSAIIWCRSLISRIETPMILFQKLSKFYTSSEFSYLVKKYNRVGKSLTSFETYHEVNWNNISQNFKINLHIPILKLSDDNSRLMVNLGGQERALLRDTQILGDSPFLINKASVIREQKEVLSELLTKRESVLLKIPTFLADLFKNLLVNLDLHCSTGLSHVTWVSLSVESFLVQLDRLINQIDDVASRVVDELSRGSSIVLTICTDFPLNCDNLTETIENMDVKFSNFQSSINSLHELSNRLSTSIFEIFTSKSAEYGYEFNVADYESIQANILKYFKSEIASGLEHFIANLIEKLNNNSLITIDLVYNFSNNSIVPHVNTSNLIGDLYAKISECLSLVNHNDPVNILDLFNQSLIDWKNRVDCAVQVAIQNFDSFTSKLENLKNLPNFDVKALNQSNLIESVQEHASVIYNLKQDMTMKSMFSQNGVDVDLSFLLFVFDSRLSAINQSFLNSIIDYIANEIMLLESFVSKYLKILAWENDDDSNFQNLYVFCDLISSCQQFKKDHDQFKSQFSQNFRLFEIFGIDHLKSRYNELYSQFLKINTYTHKIYIQNSSLVHAHLADCQSKIIDFHMKILEISDTFDLSDFSITKRPESPFYFKNSMTQSYHQIRSFWEVFQLLLIDFDLVQNCVLILSGKKVEFIGDQNISELFINYENIVSLLVSFFQSASKVENLRNSLNISILDPNVSTVLADSIQIIDEFFKYFTRIAPEIAKMSHFVEFKDHVTNFRNLLRKFVIFFDSNPNSVFFSFLFSKLNISLPIVDCNLMFILDVLLFNSKLIPIFDGIIESTRTFYLINRTKTEVIEFLKYLFITIDTNHCGVHNIQDSIDLALIKSFIKDRQSKLIGYLRNHVQFPILCHESIRKITMNFIHNLSKRYSYLEKIYQINSDLVPLLSLSENPKFVSMWNTAVENLSKFNILETNFESFLDKIGPLLV
ncbi:hypothetical protein P9112_007248 [Eukaryota sp. TZLM1-RC]